MSNSNLILLVVLVVVFAIIVFSYLHKRHHEYKMADIYKTGKFSSAIIFFGFC